MRHLRLFQTDSLANEIQETNAVLLPRSVDVTDGAIERFARDLSTQKTIPVRTEDGLVHQCTIGNIRITDNGVEVTLGFPRGVQRIKGYQETPPLSMGYSVSKDPCPHCGHTKES